MNFVVGFIINPDTRQIIFIRKNRPAFQVGKWNGIGGKIEAGETALQAMVREMVEETDIVTTEADWSHTCTLRARNDTMYFFRMFVNSIPQFKQKTDEQVAIWPLEQVYLGLPTLDNMRVILPIQFSTSIKLPIVFESVTYEG